MSRGVRRWLALGVVALGVGALFFWRPEPESAAGREGPGGAKPTPVSVAPVERGTFVERATYPGELDADAADVAATVGGRLIEVGVRVGNRVEAGQELARIDTAELGRQRAEAAAQVAAAKAAAQRATIEERAASRELERARGLHEQGLISEQELEAQEARVETARASALMSTAQAGQASASVGVLQQRMAESRLRAPFAGVITRRYEDSGNFVGVGAPVVRVVAEAPLRVVFEVPETDIGRFPRDASFDVRAAPTGERTATGRVTGTSAEVERERRVVGVEGVIEDAPSSWLPGMYAEVVTAQRTIEDATLVPATALVSRLEPGGEVATGVFQPIEDVARWVPVEVVARDDQRAAVEGALLDGPVLVAGHTDLSDGAPLLVSEPDDS